MISLRLIAALHHERLEIEDAYNKAKPSVQTGSRAAEQDSGIGHQKTDGLVPPHLRRAKPNPSGGPKRTGVSRPDQFHLRRESGQKVFPESGCRVALIRTSSRMQSTPRPDLSLTAQMELQSSVQMLKVTELQIARSKQRANQQNQQTKKYLSAAVKIRYS